MTIFQDLLNSVKGHDLDIQIKMICDSIMDEEEELLENVRDILPNGSNIFLALPITKTDVPTFLVLERMFAEEYLIRVITYVNEKYLTDKTIDVKAVKAKGVMEHYAKTYKYLEGVS